ncbi:MAG TPA: hypothetical protein VKN18_25975 [Blastocatellia bacterium]|nr:hypothetical protein [Blastocatellia bacterium]
MSLGDHGIRCGIAATLFAAAHYSSSVHAEASGAPQEVIEKARPRLTDLKKEVADYFSDWLLGPLATRPHPGKKRKADLSQLSTYYDAIIDAWRDAYDICRAKLGFRSAALRGTWRDYVKKHFSEIPAFCFPDDLIDRLQPMADWTENILAICSEQSGEDKPEDIAFEHAARMCGAGEYAFKLSSLRETYRKQKRGKI